MREVYLMGYLSERLSVSSCFYLLTGYLDTYFALGDDFRHMNPFNSSSWALKNAVL